MLQKLLLKASVLHVPRMSPPGQDCLAPNDVTMEQILYGHEGADSCTKKLTALRISNYTNKYTANKKHCYPVLFTSKFLVPKK